MEQQPIKKKNPGRLLLAILLLTIIAAAGGYYQIRNAAYETTDNAQLDGNIEPIRSGITAYLDTLCFTDNQIVKKGDTLIRFNTDLLTARLQQAQAALENARAALSASGNKANAGHSDANASRQTAQSVTQEILSARTNMEKTRQ
ncbi:MAG TPA: biotin/lipoyl-binding protein, partial [Cyclobacteriaceae bacterium]|nr:biotin/lipoyl-binding protein [Cyclobacteriaceae bacterium]